MDHVWKWRGDGKNVLETYYEHVPNHPDYQNTGSKFVKDNISEVIFRYERLPSVGTTPQTRLTYTQQVDLGGCECARTTRAPAPTAAHAYPKHTQQRSPSGL